MSIWDNYPCNGGGYYNTDFPGTHQYDQDLRWLICAYKKLIPITEDLEKRVKELEELYSTIPSEIASAVSTAMQPVYQQIQMIRNEMAKWNDDIAKTLAEQNKRISDMYLTLSSLEVYVGTIYDSCKAYTDAKTNELRKYLENYINNYLADGWPPVLCPVDGNYENINKALDDVYKAIIRPITFAEFNQLHLTFSQFNDMYIMFKVFNSWGYRELTDHVDYRFYMFSPLTGQYMLMRDVIMQLYRLHYPDGVTLSELSAGDISFEDFNNKQLTLTIFNTTHWL